MKRQIIKSIITLLLTSTFCFLKSEAQIIYTDVIPDDTIQVEEKRMFDICSKKFFVTLHIAAHHAGFFKLVQFQPDGIGAFTKFLLKSTQVGPVTAV